jgi:uncharacterized protein (PEP-CTERM system associated)
MPSVFRLAWAGAACALLLGAAQAQQSAEIEIGPDLRLPGAGLGQGSGLGGGSGGLRVATSVDLEQTFSDMRDRPNGAGGLESITRVSPAIRLGSRSGRVQGSLSYRGDLYYRTGREDSVGGEWQNYLDANLLAEAVPNFAYVDARASISQRAISAFGQPVGNGRLESDNRTEVSTLWLSPYLTGVLGGLVDYELRVIGSASNSSAEGTSDSRYGAALASIGNESRSPLGWRLTAKRERVDYTDSSVPSTTDRALFGLFWRPDVDLRLMVNGGYEAADVGGPARRESENYGAGFDWTPSPRTRVSAMLEERYFGRAHSVQLSYRSGRSVFNYSDTRSVNEGGIDPFNLGQPTTLYDLLFQQFAAIQPDPVLREQLVLAYIAATGRDPNEVVYGGTLVNGVTVERRQFLGWALSGQRTTLSLQAYRTESERIDAAAANTPGGSEVVVETGVSAVATHRLTPELAASVYATYRTTHDTPTRTGYSEKTAGLNLTSNLGRRIFGSLGARYNIYDSATDPYRETELIGRIRFEF